MHERYELSNGLTLVTERIEGLYVVSIGIFFEFGSQNETEYNNGLFHFMEHIIGKRIREAANSIAAKYNAITTKEYICFFIKCINQDFMKCLNNIMEIFQGNMLFFEIEDIKKILERELAAKRVNESACLDNLLFKKYFENDTLSLPCEGKLENIEKFTAPYIEQFVSLFSPENCVISIVGGYKYKENSQIKCLLEEWNRKQKIDKLPRVNLKNETLIESVKCNKSGISICFGGCEVINYKEELILRLINELLGGSPESKFFSEIRYKKNMCYYLYSSFLNFKRYSVFYAHVDSTNKDSEFIINEFIKFINFESFREEDIKAAKSRLINSYYYNYETTSSIMTRNAIEVLHYNNNLDLFNIIDCIDQIKTEDINYFYGRVKNMRKVIITAQNN